MHILMFVSSKLSVPQHFCYIQNANSYSSALKTSSVTVPVQLGNYMKNLDILSYQREMQHNHCNVCLLVSLSK